MNNEEKILELLVGMRGELAELKESVDTRFDAVKERLDELDSRSLRSSVLLETQVARDIRLVYEGQEMLRQKMEELAPKERVEVLEDRVIALETLVKSMSKRLAMLEKAQ